MTDNMRIVIRYMKKRVSIECAKRLIISPCRVNAEILECIATMDDEMFFEFIKPILVMCFDENIEKRETGIEPVP